MTSGEKTPVSKADETKPVVWTPEDASRFLTSAIHEAQRPLADALKQRPITSKALSMIIAVLVAAALAIVLILTSQLEKAEKRADADRASRDAMYSEKAHLEAGSVALEDRIAAARQQQEILQGQIAGMRGSEEELRRARGEIQRFRRQNELLRNQIAGLEMEKVALGRQLEAVRALAIEDDSLDELGDLDDVDEDIESDGLGLMDTADTAAVPETEPDKGAAFDDHNDGADAPPVGEVVPTADPVANDEEEAQEGTSSDEDSVGAKTDPADADDAAITGDAPPGAEGDDTGENSSQEEETENPVLLR